MIRESKPGPRWLHTRTRPLRQRGRLSHKRHIIDINNRTKYNTINVNRYNIATQRVTAPLQNAKRTDKNNYA